jgi:hypothetical protein
MKKYTKILTLAAVTLTLSSCLKDKGYEADKYGINQEEAESFKVINLPTPSTNLIVDNAVKTYAYSATVTPRTINVPVHLSAKNVASEDIKVTVTLANSATLATTYNNTLVYPAQPFVSTTFGGKFSAPTTVTIPAGSRDAVVPITFSTPDVDPGKYFFGLSIASVDKAGYTISTNQLNSYTLVLFNNEFQATNYTSTMAAVPGGAATKTKSVLTVSKYTSAIEVHNLAAAGSMFITVNPATNAVTIAPDPRAGAVAKTVVASGVNTYDPATKTFTLNYTYTNASGVPVVVSETAKRP